MACFCMSVYTWVFLEWSKLHVVSICRHVRSSDRVRRCESKEKAPTRQSVSSEKKREKQITRSLEADSPTTQKRSERNLCDELSSDPRNILVKAEGGKYRIPLSDLDNNREDKTFKELKRWVTSSRYVMWGFRVVFCGIEMQTFCKFQWENTHFTINYHFQALPNMLHVCIPTKLGALFWLDFTLKGKKHLILGYIHLG